ncbi:MAG TPA: GerMN domain-containing protein [bacterium]|nr:GerMN domain-containing protein [bacterium]
MNSKFPVVKVTIAVAAFFLIVFGVFFFLKFHGKAKSLELAHNANSTPLFETGDKPMKVYIKAVEMDNGKLFNLQETIYQSKTRINQMRQLLLAFLNGPRTGKDQVPVPEGLKLNDFYFTPQGTAVVDISTDQIVPGKFGFYEEVLFIRALIETMSQNFFEIKQVKVLVDGKDAKTLAGHYALGSADLGAPVMQNVNSF